jgi:flagellar basal-body rod modification protein FlgD
MRVESQSNTQSSTTGSSVLSGQNDVFMQLLLAQLKSQDPMSPMDANQFVDQMVQFNTLDQITQIRAMLETVVQATSPSES